MELEVQAPDAEPMRHSCRDHPPSLRDPQPFGKSYLARCIINVALIQNGHDNPLLFKGIIGTKFPWRRSSLPPLNTSGFL